MTGRPLHPPGTIRDNIRMSPPAARFLADLARIAARDAARLRLGIALSGGPDSVALLLLAAEALPGQVAAATVDHGLRAEAAAEAAFCADLCARLSVPHATLPVTVTPSGSGLQAAARAARYAALEDWRAGHNLDLVATAHHADDQAETLLMRASRGAGIGGMAGIRARNGAVVRPLLGWRRAALGEIVSAAGIAAVRDPSNHDPRYDRTRVRSLLRGQAELDVPGMASTAAHLADAEDALAWATDQLWAERVREDGEGMVIDPAGLPAELLHRLVRAILRRLDGGTRADRIAPLIDRLNAGESASIGSLIARPGPRWTFAPAPPRRENTTKDGPNA